MTARHLILIVVSLGLIQGTQLSRAAEPSGEQRKRNPKNEEPPPARPPGAARWRFGGSLRGRLERWDWFDAGPSAADRRDEYAFFGSYVRLTASRASRRVDVFAEACVPLLVGLPRDATAPAPQGQLGLGAAYRDANRDRVIFAFLRQGYVTFKGLLDGKTSLRLGRFEFIEGQESMTQDATLDWIKRERIASRLVANFAFTHVQRTFDGLDFTRASPAANVTIVAARPTEGVFKLDANRELADVNVVYAGLTRTGRARDYDARLFYVFYRDDRGVSKVDNRPLPFRAVDRASIAISTLGGHYARKAGRADVLAWGSWQAGDWGRQRHRGWAWVAEGGYQPKMPLDPWLRLGANRSSGDPDTSDGDHRTFFQMLPTARIYARFPFFNAMNLQDHFAQVVLRPTQRVTIRFDHHWLRLSQSRDLWYSGGGAYDSSAFGFSGRPAGGSRNLGRLLDLQVDYRPEAKTTLTFYYGHAYGGSVVRGVYPAGASANLVFWEISRRF